MPLEVAQGVVGRQAQAAVGVAHRLLAPAEIGQRRARQRPRHRAARAGGERTLEQLQRRLRFLAEVGGVVGEHGERERVGRIGRQRAFGEGEDRRRVRPAVERPALADAQAVPVRRPGGRQGEARVLGHRLLEVVARAEEPGAVLRAHGVQAAQHVVIGRQALGPLAHRLAQRGRADVGRDAGDDAPHRVFLRREQLAVGEVEPLAPELLARRPVHQAQGEVEAAGAAAHRPADDKAHAEGARHALRRGRLAEEHARAFGRDHEHLVQPGERGGHVLHDPRGEVRVRRVGLRVLERQDGDRGQRAGRRRQRHGDAARRVEAEGTHGPREVAQRQRAEVARGRAVRGRQRRRRLGREHGAAGHREFLEARGEVHRLAEDAFALGDHGADVDGDAEGDGRLVRRTLARRLGGGVQAARPGDRGGRVGELGERAVALHVHDAPAQRGGGGHHVVAQQGEPPLGGAGLVGRGEHRPAHHVGEGDRHLPPRERGLGERARLGGGGVGGHGISRQVSPSPRAAQASAR